MNTRFDHFTDDQIEEKLLLYHRGLISYRQDGDDLTNIACLAGSMLFYNCWLGAPVTFYQPDGMDYDGHHRVRGVKFLRTRYDREIHYPCRYDRRMTGFRSLSDEKDYDACRTSASSG